MDFNKNAVETYLSNIDANGKRIRTWKVIEEKGKTDKVTLSKISSIRKRSSDQEFDLFVECMRNKKPVRVSNGTNSYNIQHISTLLREGNRIVSEGAPTTTVSRKDRSALYVLESAGYYKIGVTLDTSIAHRIRQLQIGNPHLINLVASTGAISNAYELEKKLQQQYKKLRVRGEWFRLSTEEVQNLLAEVGKS
ncbi:hypothetical protein AD45P3_00145 [Alteromonas phage vB_AmaP_AD45-P3]|nr:hypothetical protein AD45P3_00145 [Alteromonas phage vB_AmaP_AD45-P3]